MSQTKCLGLPVGSIEAVMGSLVFTIDLGQGLGLAPDPEGVVGIATGGLPLIHILVLALLVVHLGVEIGKIH